jgi:hypothetical protein
LAGRDLGCYAFGYSGGAGVTELVFKGKEFVFNHHLTVPFRPLEMHPSKGIGAPSLDGNLIIHGDNLHALKSLLPTHAGKVDCILLIRPTTPETRAGITTTTSIHR